MSAHNLSISIELWDPPLRMESYINGKLTEIKNIWIKKVMAKSQKISELPVKLLSQRVDENIDDEKIWLDAWYIQD